MKGDRLCICLMAGLLYFAGWYITELTTQVSRCEATRHAIVKPAVQS